MNTGETPLPGYQPYQWPPNGGSEANINQPLEQPLADRFAEIQAMVAAPIDYDKPLSDALPDAAARNARKEFMQEHRAFGIGSTLLPESGIDPETGEQTGADLFTAGAETAAEQARQDALDAQDAAVEMAARADQRRAELKAAREAAREAEVQKELDKIEARRNETRQAAFERAVAEGPEGMNDANAMLDVMLREATKTGDWTSFHQAYDSLPDAERAAYAANPSVIAALEEHLGPDARAEPAGQAAPEASATNPDNVDSPFLGLFDTATPAAAPVRPPAPRPGPRRVTQEVPVAPPPAPHVPTARPVEPQPAPAQIPEARPEPRLRPVRARVQAPVRQTPEPAVRPERRRPVVGDDARDPFAPLRGEASRAPAESPVPRKRVPDSSHARGQQAVERLLRRAVDKVVGIVAAGAVVVPYATYTSPAEPDQRATSGYSDSLRREPLNTNTRFDLRAMDAAAEEQWREERRRRLS